MASEVRELIAEGRAIERKQVLLELLEWMNWVSRDCPAIPQGVELEPDPWRDAFRQVRNKIRSDFDHNPWRPNDAG